MISKKEDKHTNTSILFEHVYIYGAGNYGRKLYGFLRDNKICQVEGFVQTKRRIGESACEGLPIVTPDELPMVNTLVLLAVSDALSAKDIRSDMVMRGKTVWDCASFIHDNLLSYKYFCVVCGESVDGFEEDGVDSELFHKYTVIGAGKRDNCVCPKCNCYDRARWFWWILNNKTRILHDECSVLHFAPEPQIPDKVKRLNPECNYVTADIVPGRADIVADITNTPFRDACFDYIIANHVLEHVPVIKETIDELKRVLKNDGKIILSFPICLDKKTEEGIDTDSALDRLLKYGQDDHVRLFGNDYKDILKSYGLTTEIFRPCDILKDEEIRCFGFLKEDVVIICRGV